jgi:hypothetical protein
VHKPHVWPTPSRRGGCYRSYGISLFLRATATEFDKAMLWAVVALGLMEEGLR